jgi:hypothetical protein
MTTTGKKARRTGGNRYDCKRRKARKPKQKTFGKLPVSVRAGNAPFK